MLTRKMLRDACKELNEVMGLDPAIDIEEGVPVLTANLKEALQWIKPEDSFSASTTQVLNEISSREIPVVKGPTIVIPPIEDEPEEEALEDELAEQIEGAKRLADLKNIAKANDEFAPLRGKLSSFNSMADLKAAMLVQIGVSPTPEYVDQDKEEPAHKPTKATRAPSDKPKGRNVIYFDESEIIPGLKVGSLVKFTSAPNSKVAPKQELIGTVLHIKKDSKTPHEVLHLQTDVGVFFKLTKGCTLAKK